MSQDLSSCPACNCPASRWETHAEFPPGPVHQNRLFPTKDAARACPRGQVKLALCRDCGLVANAAFDPTLLDYDAAYENAQHHSPYFTTYLEELVAVLMEQEHLDNKMLIEVGCGDGRMLQRFCRDGRNRGIGFDPAYRGPLTVGSARYVQAYYGPEFAEYSGDFTYARHVLEHIPKPLAFLECVKTATRPDGGVFLEVPDLGWIVEHDAIWDIFYEHCNYFTRQSLTALARRAGLNPTQCRYAFGGQYLWFQAGIDPVGVTAPADPSDAEEISALSRRLLDFAARSQRRREELQQWIGAQAQRGPGVLWGAGAKGVTFLNQLEINEAVIPWVVDINPRKQGQFLAGVGRLIVPPAALREIRPHWVVIMNPNYREEIVATLSELGLGETSVIVI